MAIRLRGDPEILDFICGNFLAENPEANATFIERFDEARLKAKEIISFNLQLPFRFVSESAIKGHIRADQEVAGFNDKVAEAKLRFAKMRQADLETRDHGRTRSVLALLEPNFLHIPNQTGPCRYYRQEGSYTTLERLREDAVKDRDIQLAVINENKLSSELRTWINSFDGAFAIDDVFVMKRAKGNGVRSVLQRTGDPYNDHRFARELSLLRQLVDVTHWAYEPIKAGMVRFLNQHCLQIETEKVNIREENYRQLTVVKVE